MAHPKSRTCKSRRDKRRTHKKLSLPTFNLCPQCREPKRPHSVCLSCGTYKGREVIEVKEAS